MVLNFFGGGRGGEMDMERPLVQVGLYTLSCRGAVKYLIEHFSKTPPLVHLAVCFCFFLKKDP